MPPTLEDITLLTLTGRPLPEDLTRLIPALVGWSDDDQPMPDMHIGIGAVRREEAIMAAVWLHRLSGLSRIVFSYVGAAGPTPGMGDLWNDPRSHYVVGAFGIDDFDEVWWKADVHRDDAGVVTLAEPVQYVKGRYPGSNFIEGVRRGMAGWKTAPAAEAVEAWLQAHGHLVVRPAEGTRNLWEIC